MVIKLFLLSLIAFCGLEARDITNKTRPHDATYYIDYFFSGWMPTMVAAGGVATHYIINRKPIDVCGAARQIKKTTVSNFNLLTASLVFSAACILYSYYKPRFSETMDNIRNKGTVW